MKAGFILLVLYLCFHDRVSANLQPSAPGDESHRRHAQDVLEANLEGEGNG